MRVERARSFHCRRNHRVEVLKPLKMPSVPPIRIQDLNTRPPRGDGDYVLYWMIANRRSSWNYSLDRAIEWSKALGKPLLVFEALRSGYPWASDRLHRFVMQGMADNRRSFANSSVRYYCYVEPKPGHGRGLLERLATQASVIVTDDFPCFFLPRMIQSVSERVVVKLEAVDSNGVLPMRAADRVFARAYDFRRWLQKHLVPHLNEHPQAKPLSKGDLPAAPSVSREIHNRWPEASDRLLSATSEQLAGLPIDHQVGPAVFDGGSTAAQKIINRFLKHRLSRYSVDRNDPENEAASGLSPYLHFGHVSAHDIFHRLIEREDWTPEMLADKSTGAREGWWGMSPEAESFLDELITWRELGFNMCWQRDDYDQYESLPEWAQRTLAEHAGDERKHLYEMQQFESAATHDPLWNAAQTQLVCEGRMHNYLRMLWGKKILEWSPTPQDALATMIELNNKFAVDGRNPNSYSGIFWVLGRYDRAWGPERPIFGKIRYMSSDNTARKLNVKGYLKTYSG